MCAAPAMLFSCAKPAIVEVSSVSLNHDEYELVVGDSIRLEADVIPYNATDKSVGWLSSDSSVAVVDDEGLVVALGEGEAVITARAGEMSAACSLKVIIDRDLPSVILPGDFFLADGTILSRDADVETVRASEVIGIVFSTDLLRMSDFDKEYLSGKGYDRPCGFVLALRNVEGESYSWYTDLYTTAYLRDETEIGIPDALAQNDPYGTYELADNDFNGFENMSLIREQRADGYEAGYYPAFQAAYDYNAAVPVPENATPWYMPSNGQLFELLRNLGDADIDPDNMYPVNDDDFMWEGLGEMVSAINSSMQKVSETLMQPVNEGGVFWTSSPASPAQARFVYMTDAGTVICMRSAKNSTNIVRPVLTFGSTY